MAIREQSDARKAPISGKDALGVIAGATRIVVAKGRRVETFEMKKAPPDEESLLKQLLGPTGNLRAPALRKGKTLVIGYNDAVYADLFA